jgi:DNA-binding beta-propeller fold protein YncE
MRPLTLALLLTSALSAADSGYKILAKYPAAGDGSWDYVGIDSAARRLYLSHGTQVNVLDADTGKEVGMIPDTPGVHGIVVAAPFKHGFTTNGREDKASVFDPATLALIKKMDVGKGPDSIYYDAASKRVFTGNHGSHDITAIDAERAEVVGTVKVEGDAEASITGKDGLIYANLEDKNEVVVFDPKTLEVKRRMPIGVAGTPTGLAYDSKTNRLFIGCRQKPALVVMDAASGKVVASYSIGGNVDWVSYDSANAIVFAACGEGVLNVFHQKSADNYEDLGPVKTEPGAKTMAFDPKTKRVYLSTAEVVMKDGRRAVTPNTFHVLVVGK